MRCLTSFTVKFSENISSEMKDKIIFMEKEKIMNLTLLSQLMAVLPFPQASFLLKMY